MNNPVRWESLSFIRQWEILRHLPKDHHARLLGKSGPSIIITAEMQRCKLAKLRDLIVAQFPESGTKSCSSAFDQIDNVEELGAPGDVLKEKCVVFHIRIGENCQIMELMPPEIDTSFRFARKFGSDRFLYVQSSVESLERFSFLRRNYEFFSGDGETMIYFAVSGPGLVNIPVSSVYEWHIPLKNSEFNSKIPMFKYAARLGLAFTRATPVVVLTASQIVKIEDSETDFNGKFYVTTDGCAPASMALFELISERLNLNYIPSAIQGRIGSCKGIWYVDMADPKSFSEIYLKFRPSQLKYEINQPDEFQLTFEVKKVSKPFYSCSSLNVQFIQTLPCPLHVFEELAADYLFKIHSMIIQDTDFLSSKELYHFLSNLGDSALVKECKTLVAAGFGIEEPYVRKSVLDFLKFCVSDGMLEKFHIPVQQSSRCFAIADPTGTLSSGQIFFYQSSVRKQSKSIFLHPPNSCRFNSEVMISRNPCKSPKYGWIKARNVWTDALSAYKDVVVFPISCVLSSMEAISGDYDGDEVFITWDKRIVEHGIYRTELPQPPISNVEDWLKDNKTTINDALMSDSIQSILVCVHNHLKNLELGLWDSRCTSVEESASDMHLVDVLRWFVVNLLEKKKSGVEIGPAALQFKANHKTYVEPIWKARDINLPKEKVSESDISDISKLWITLRNMYIEFTNNVPMQVMKSIGNPGTYFDSDLCLYFQSFQDTFDADFLNSFLIPTILKSFSEYRELCKSIIFEEEAFKIDDFIQKFRRKIFALSYNKGISPEFTSVLIYLITRLPPVEEIEISSIFKMNLTSNSIASKFSETAFPWKVCSDYLCRIKSDLLKKQIVNDPFAIAQTAIYAP
jgi:hypothetical protein